LAAKQEAAAKAAEDRAAREKKAAEDRKQAEADAAESTTKYLQAVAAEYGFTQTAAQAAFQEMILGGKSAAEALKEMVSVAYFDSPQGIADIVQGLGELKTGAQVTGEQIQTALIDRLKNLPAQELADFGVMAQMAFDQGKMSAEQMAQVMDAQTRVALQQLGLDADVALTGMSKKFLEASGNVDIIASRFDHLRETGADAGAVLGQSLEQAMKSAANTQEIDLLIAKVKQLGEEGRLSEEKVTALLEKLGKKSDEAKEGINSVSEALKNLGVRSDADLKKTADGFKTAYEAVKKMGGSVREQQEAFKVYAKAAIDANGGVADSSLKVEAAMNGLEITTDKAGKSIVQAMSAGKGATDDLADSLDNAAASAQRLGEGVKALEGGDFTKDGFVTDASGNPVRHQKTARFQTGPTKT